MFSSFFKAFNLHFLKRGTVAYTGIWKHTVDKGCCKKYYFLKGRAIKKNYLKCILAHFFLPPIFALKEP